MASAIYELPIWAYWRRRSTSRILKLDENQAKVEICDVIGSLIFQSYVWSKFGQNVQEVQQMCFRCCHIINEVRKIPIVAGMKRKSIECIYCWSWKFWSGSFIKRAFCFELNRPATTSLAHLFNDREAICFFWVSLFYMLRVYISEKIIVRYFRCIWELVEWSMTTFCILYYISLVKYLVVTFVRERRP